MFHGTTVTAALGKLTAEDTPTNTTAAATASEAASSDLTLSQVMTSLSSVAVSKPKHEGNGDEDCIVGPLVELVLLRGEKYFTVTIPVTDLHGMIPKSYVCGTTTKPGTVVVFLLLSVYRYCIPVAFSVPVPFPCYITPPLGTQARNLCC